MRRSKNVRKLKTGIWEANKKGREKNRAAHLETKGHQKKERKNLSSQNTRTIKDRALYPIYLMMNNWK